ncbi:NERD domain-containing protein [Nitriliruptoraceae bacterium ZYF776]|nr:NERD domain-containing protein [Profundirhabdus halotolerans]
MATVGPERRAAGTGAAARAAELQAGTPFILRAAERLAGIRTEDRAWAEGAKGERRVARALERLERRGWHVVHDLTVGTRGANIDHVVVGPPGVFVIDTKYTRAKVVVHRSTIRFDGYARTGYLRGVERQRQLATDRLSAAVGFEVPVRSILCLVVPLKHDAMKVVSSPEGCQVVHVEGLVRACRRHSRHPQLSDQQLARIAQVLGDPEVWLPSAPAERPSSSCVSAAAPPADAGATTADAEATTSNVWAARRAPTATRETATRETATQDAATRDVSPATPSPDRTAPPPGPATEDREVRTAEWKRYGKHRIYANDADGASLGWIDVPSGEVHLAGPPDDHVAAVLRSAREQLLPGPAVTGS